MAAQVEIIDLTAASPPGPSRPIDVLSDDNDDDDSSTRAVRSTPSSKQNGKAKQSSRSLNGKKRKRDPGSLELGEVTSRSGSAEGSRRPSVEREKSNGRAVNGHGRGERSEKSGGGRKRGREEYELDERDRLRRRVNTRHLDCGDHSTSSKPSIDRSRDTRHTHTDDYDPSTSRLRSRSRSRSRENHADASSRSHRHQNSRRSESPPLFFCIDVKPADVPDVRALLSKMVNDVPSESVTSTAEPSTSTSADVERAENRLLLPAHVSVDELESAAKAGADTIEIIRPPTPDENGEDFIEYLDYDDRQVRGFSARTTNLFFC